MQVLQQCTMLMLLLQLSLLRIMLTWLARRLMAVMTSSMARTAGREEQ